MSDDDPEYGSGGNRVYKTNVLRELNAIVYKCYKLFDIENATISEKDPEVLTAKRDLFNRELRGLREYIFNHLGDLKKLDKYDAFDD